MIEKTVEYINRKEKTINSYDDMYNWWHNENNGFNDLSDNEKLYIIQALNFKVKIRPVSPAEVEISDYIAHSITSSIPEKKKQEIIDSCDNNEEKTPKFFLEDLDQANLSNIESLYFDDLDDILTRLDSYLLDYFAEY